MHVILDEWREWIKDPAMNTAAEPLSEKIARFEREIKDCERRIGLLKERLRMARELLAEEEEVAESHAQQPMTFPAPVDFNAVPLKSLVLSILSTTTPSFQDQIVRELEPRVNTGGKSLKRSVNATLLALRHKGIVERVGEKQWKRVELAKPAESDGGLQ